MEDNRGIEDQNKDIEKEEAYRKAEAIKEKASVGEVMNTKGGRHLVWVLLSECGVYRDAFDADPYIHARNAGDKAAGLRLLHKILSVCPKDHELMFSEHKYQEEKDEEK
ncbi:MAG: hypothetical protein CMB80_01725 [Flammeovirgaceae bacterium]|nr:hypothetical protein [Flammeovirgaceae bacterium]|tara:strand:+ start:868 stop:1194 length:327 start_codon:yes stop_codon:yes gene_type:complete